MPLNYEPWKKNSPGLRQKGTSFGSSISGNWKKENVSGIGWRRAEDTGSAVRGNIIDIYVGEGEKARHEALRAGRRQVKILYREARA